jgi:hypothetical protein
MRTSRLVSQSIDALKHQAEAFNWQTGFFPADCHALCYVHIVRRIDCGVSSERQAAAIGLVAIFIAAVLFSCGCSAASMVLNDLQ